MDLPDVEDVEFDAREFIEGKRRIATGIKRNYCQHCDRMSFCLREVSDGLIEFECRFFKGGDSNAKKFQG